jgi:hypothetical protein
MNYQLELDENSDKIDQPSNINIILKDHQLSMIQKCIEIENNNICGIGIMSDKPGCGKTFAILGFIYQSYKKGNIIVIPQNILGQWCESIHQFTDGLITYKKFIDYSDILDLYNPNTNLFEYDILITTALYYNAIATSMENKTCRVFFDEIDSISSFVVNKINANFIWFVSASFNYDEIGIYKTILDKELMPFITCKCKDDYIDNQFGFEHPNIYKIICKNIYLDNIFSGLVTKEEFKILNAMDYSKLKRKFTNKIAQTEIEAVDILVKDKLDIIEIEELRIIDLKKAIETTDDNQRLKILNEQLDKSTKSLNDSQSKLNLIRDRLKENNCCPSCYNEFNDFDKKILSPCCKNIICDVCTNNWFNNMKKTNCIFCNKEEVKYEDYILIKKSNENDSKLNCLSCDIEFTSIDDRYYSICCDKGSCKNCLSEWFHKLFKTKCLYCHQHDKLFEDFKNKREHDDMKLNIQNGIKYTNKTKIEFIEYFTKTKIFSDKSKVIICSNYIRIFNDIKKLFKNYNVKYLELDDGNIDNINNSIKKYVYGNINVLLLNSNLFGCGLNLQCTTDILFLHKTEYMLEKQIIGRAQRNGRVNKLNIWYIMHENEKIITTKRTTVFGIDIFSAPEKIVEEKSDEISAFNDLINNSEEINAYNNSINNYEYI